MAVSERFNRQEAKENYIWGKDGGSIDAFDLVIDALQIRDIYPSYRDLRKDLELLKELNEKTNAKARLVSAFERLSR